MGLVNSKEYFNNRRRIDEATSNTSLSNLRYVAVEKPRWKVFAKREIRPIPIYQPPINPRKGCMCGGSAPCKQKVTPKGVTIHYPQKKRALRKEKKYKPPDIDKGYLTNKDREVHRVKIVRPRKFTFPIPTWRVDKLLCESPFQRPDLPPQSMLTRSQPITGRHQPITTQQSLTFSQSAAPTSSKQSQVELHATSFEFIKIK